MARFGCALALVLGWLGLGSLDSRGSFAAFVGRLDPFSVGSSRKRQRRGAVGHFPAREDLDVSPPNRKALLERLQRELPASNVEEHTEEIRLLRDQTALLAQDLRCDGLQFAATVELLCLAPCPMKELRLLREVLQEGSLLSQIESLANGLGQEHEALTPPGVAEPEPKQVAPAATAATSRLQFRDTLGKGKAFRAPEALESLAHLSARVVERRRNGELPLGQVPSIG